MTSSAANERHWYWLMELKVKVLMHLTGTSLRVVQTWLATEYFIQYLIGTSIELYLKSHISIFYAYKLMQKETHFR